MFGPVAAMAIAALELRIACIRAYNDWLIEFCAAAPYCLLGVAILPLEDRP
jgi:predicted TIM-barrel fold metal-dependent hydrolase